MLDVLQPVFVCLFVALPCFQFVVINPLASNLSLFSFEMFSLFVISQVEIRKTKMTHQTLFNLLVSNVWSFETLCLFFTFQVEHSIQQGTIQGTIHKGCKV